MLNKRLAYIDIAKGFGIVLVVLGHTGIGKDWIYLFHMPLFFFLSGVLYKEDINQRAFIIKKSRSLLIPYVLFLVILYTIQVYLQYRHQSISSRGLVNLLLYPLLGGRWLSGYVTVFWFITCLFFTQVFYNFLAIKSASNRLSIVVFLLLLLAYCNSIFLNIRLPWNINVVLYTVPIFHCGVLYKKLHFPTWLTAIIISLGILGLVVVRFSSTVSVDLKVANYGIPIFSFIVGIGLSVLTINLCKLIPESFCSLLFLKIGIASLVIMYLHQVLIAFISSFFQNCPIFLIAILSVGISYLVYLLLAQAKFTRRYFLGIK